MKEQLAEIKKQGYGLSKTHKVNLHIAAWKEQGWAHPYFHNVVQWKEGCKREVTNQDLPWDRMLVKVGGEDKAKSMLQDSFQLYS